MADKNEDKATTITLPAREVTARPLGDSPVFKEMWEQERGPVKTLGEAGLTRVIVVYLDRKGVMRSISVLVPWETSETVVGMLTEEQLG